MDFNSVFAKLEQLCAGRRLVGWQGAPVTAMVEITGEGGGEVFVSADSSGIRLSRGRSTADCTASLSMATAEKLLTGRMKPAMAMMTGAVRIKGDAARVMSAMKYIR